MFKFVFTAALALVIGACSKNNNLDPIANATTASQERDLQEKSFTSNCEAKPVAGITSMQVAYLFQGANMTRTTRYFKTPDCTADADITLVEHGTFNLHTNQRTADGGKAIDIEYHQLIVTTVTQQGVAAANVIGLCGAHDWSQNSQRDENAHAADLTCLGAAVPRHDANVYRIDGKVLYFGVHDNKSTDPAQRPAGLDTTTPYTAP